MTRRRKSALPASALEAGTIMMFAPSVFATRMAQMMSGSPAAAHRSLGDFAAEKADAATRSAMDAGAETIRQSARVTRAVIRQDVGEMARAGEAIAMAALRPISSRVRANARQKS